jgi:hypothetical protein
MPAGFRRTRAREQQRVRVDGNGLMRDVIGDAGLDDAGVVALGQRLDDVTLICPELTAYVVGQVVYLVEAAATLARATVGAVLDDRDDARRLAYGLAGRPGYEPERAEVQRLASRREARYVV